MEFGKQGVEADAFKVKDHMSQQTASDLASMTQGQQDQVMRQQMEQLQRLVAEQQKIIALYNPEQGKSNTSEGFSETKRSSDDDAKPQQAQYPSQHGPQRVDHTDGHFDLSDGDYASDEPSGTEKMSVKRTRMDQLKTVRSQELTHPLEYNRDQIHPLQKEKVAHSKFKGTARVTAENVKSQEIQILKQQIAGLQEEFKRNESCWHAAYSKLRDQVEMLTRQNMELRDELRVSEHQRRKAEKSPEAVNFMDRKSETPVAEAILQETASSSKQEERARRDNRKSHGISHVGPKTSLQKHFFRDVNSKVVHQLSTTGRTTDDRKSPGAVSHPSGGFKEPNSSSYVKGRSLPISDSSEDMSLSHNHSNDTCSFALCSNNEETEVEEVLTDGRQIITFPNGTKKEISADKRMTTISFFNGDVKKIMPDQRVIYYYADAQTTHIAYPDGLEVLQFPNNQIEKHYPDGTQEIVFPDHTVKCLYSDGFKETFFPDGTVVKVEKSGDKIVVFSNGQKEIHTAQFKRREYPDGTVKTVYRNGRQETKHSSGRVRIKDEDDSIILDKK
ncbi:PREDICTED: centromere protein J-like [Phaethon lepturus]|uniref:centromere protein J-like n=1 Tax=Phaethon lepturus TaxID=97097 RepID=UPI000530B764|nr:PREDICTED: centromere protein J-like [Phaethon lepturus]